MMIINPTVKAMPLFSTIPKVKDIEAAKEYCSENPIYSWHANYYTVNRKKILILVNDLTLLTIVIQDVNAESKKYLDHLIRDSIFKLLMSCGIAPDKIERYMDNANEILIGKGHKRNITSIVTQNIMMAETFEYHELLWAELMDFCNNMIFSTTNYVKPIDKTIEVFEEL